MTDEEMKKALEWKPWYCREEELTPAIPLKDPVKQMIDQAIKLEEAKEFLLQTEGEGFHKEHEEFIERVFQTLDEDNRVALNTFMSELFQDRLKKT